MFDAVVCVRMTLGPPQASVAALTVHCEVLALRRADPAIDGRSDSPVTEDKSDEAIDEGDEQATGAWSARDDRIQPIEEMREEVTRVLADLLLEALGIKSPASQTGGDDESEDLD